MIVAEEDEDEEEKRAKVRSKCRSRATKNSILLGRTWQSAEKKKKKGHNDLSWSVSL